MKHEFEFKVWWERQEIWRTNKWMNDAMESLWRERDEMLDDRQELIRTRNQLSRWKDKYGHLENESYMTAEDLRVTRLELEKLREKVKSTGRAVKRVMTASGELGVSRGERLVQALSKQGIFEDFST